MKDVPPRPSRDRATVEQMAHILCRADGLDPEQMIYPGVPWTTRWGYMPATEPQEAWTFYHAMAERVVDAAWVAERKRERGE